MPKDPVKYWKSIDVRDIAKSLIPEFHPHLEGESILYLFRSEHTVSDCKPVWGKARRVTGLNAYLTNHEAIEELNGAGDDPNEKSEAAPLKVVEIAFDVWLALDASQRVALVDHELSHFAANGGMQSHDVEEFRSVVERHGLWRPDVKSFAETIAQQNLFPAKSEAESAAVKAAKNIGRTMRKGESVTISRPGHGAGVTIEGTKGH